ncbi:hypothetical protein MD484_g1418, partial [Candolleomyces efflorescens]
MSTTFEPLPNAPAGSTPHGVVELLADGNGQSFDRTCFHVAGRDVFSLNVTITQANPAIRDFPNRQALFLKSKIAEWGRSMTRLLTFRPTVTRRVVSREGIMVLPTGTGAKKPTTATIYQDSMLDTPHGLPLWEPRPPQVGEQGTSPGDVGTLSAAGGFEKIFNVWADIEAIRNANLSGHLYEPPEMKIVTRKEALVPSEPITQGTTTETKYTNGQ